jgi:ABC-type enterochelin transport system permease subunit
MTSLHQVLGRAAADPPGSDDDVVTHDRLLLITFLEYVSTALVSPFDHSPARNARALLAFLANALACGRLGS